MDILALSNLLRESKGEGNNHETKHQTSTHNSTPVSFGFGLQQYLTSSNCILKKSNGAVVRDNHPDDNNHSNNINNYDDDDQIWNLDEIQKNDTTTPNSRKPQPNHQLYFKQVVGAEDIFLGASKSKKSAMAGSMDSTHIVLKVHFPNNCNLNDLNLDVERKYLKVSSPESDLEISLPREVDPDRGEAKWDPSSEILTVTLPIDDERMNMLYE